MNRYSVAAVFAAACCGVMIAMSAPDSSAGSEKKSQVLRHVVLFQFQEDTSSEKVDEIVKEFAALPEKIDAIQDFEWGTDVSVENRSHGFTHGFVVTFADEKGRDEYLPHPAHQAFVKLLRPHLKDVLVFDYRADT